MKKLLSTLLIATISNLVIPQFTNAETLENKSTETKGEALSSSIITGKVKAALLVKEGVQANDINVTSEISKDGKTAIVTLSGTQNSKGSVILAGHIAKSIKNVAKVNNQLTVAQKDH